MTMIKHDEHETDRIERLERVYEPTPVVVAPLRSNINVAAGAAGLWTAASVVTLLLTVLEVLLLLRFLFKLGGANPNQPLVSALYGATEPLARPFQGIFAEPSGTPILDISALLAIVFLLLITALVIALVRAVTASRQA